MKRSMKGARLIGAAICVVGASSAFGATVRFDNGAGTNTWENPVNWNTNGAGPDGVAGTGDDTNTDGLPTAADVASISPTTTTGAPLTVNLSSSQSVTEVEISNQAGSGSSASGTATLNVLPGAVLNVNNGSNGTAGIRIGRGLAAGQTATAQQGSVIQTGGTVLSRVRLSPEANSADGLYRISGGNLIGGSTVANGATAGGTAATADLIVGLSTATFTKDEFHVQGSGASSIRFVDVQVGDSQNGSGGRAVFHFSLDAGGVTPIIAEDEFQFRAVTANAGSGLLQVDLIGVAPTSDVTLVIADRLGNNGGTGGTDIAQPNGGGEHFTNYVDGQTLIATGAGYNYTYIVDYTDDSDNFVAGTNAGLGASIILRYQSRELISVPEPTTLAALGAAGLLLGRRRSR